MLEFMGILDISAKKSSQPLSGVKNLVLDSVWFNSDYGNPLNANAKIFYFYVGYTALESGYSSHNVLFWFQFEVGTWTGYQPRSFEFNNLNRKISSDVIYAVSYSDFAVGTIHFKINLKNFAVS